MQRLQNIMKVTQEYSDKTAISLSLICLAHCLLVPILLVLFSGYVTLSYNNELIHYLLLLLAIPVSLYALFRGMRNHSKLIFFVIGLLGITALIFAVTIGTAIWGEFGEKLFTTIGASLIVFAHYKNYKLCRKLECDSCHSA